MKTSEAIKRLQELMEEWGDLPLYYLDNNGYDVLKMPLEIGAFAHMEPATYEDWEEGTGTHSHPSIICALEK